MENKLKTLKDLEAKIIRDHTIPEGNIICDVKLLRQEKIKHVKQIKEAVSNNGKGMPDFLIPYEHIKDWRGQCMTVVRYIMWANNLTEEDLK